MERRRRLISATYLLRRLFQVAGVRACVCARVRALLAHLHALMRKHSAHMLRPRLPTPNPPFLIDLLPEEHFETDTRRMQNTLIALRGGRRGGWGGEGVLRNGGKGCVCVLWG